jgi:hypothetical protein
MNPIFRDKRLKLPRSDSRRYGKGKLIPCAGGCGRFVEFPRQYEDMFLNGRLKLSSGKRPEEVIKVSCPKCSRKK